MEDTEVKEVQGIEGSMRGVILDWIQEGGLKGGLKRQKPLVAIESSRAQTQYHQTLR